MADNREALTLRIDPDLSEDLRLHRALTGQSTNDLVTILIREFMKTTGRPVIIAALGKHRP